MKKRIPIYLLLAVCFACSTSKSQTQNESKKQSYYDLQRFDRSHSSDSIIVIGSVHSLSGEIFSQAAIDVNDERLFRANGNEYIIIRLGPGKYTFTGLWIHFEPLKTEVIEINKGDSLRLNFYLKEEISLH